MKLLQTLTVGALLTAMVTHAPAQTLHVVGSTAFRTATSIAIIDFLSGQTAANGFTGALLVYMRYSNGTNPMR